jgi:hypothetical protein
MLTFLNHAGRSPALIEEQESPIIQDLLTHAAENMFFSKGEFLDEIEWAYRRVLTSEWSH